MRSLLKAEGFFNKEKDLTITVEWQLPNNMARATLAQLYCPHLKQKRPIYTKTFVSRMKPGLHKANSHSVAA